MEKPREMQKKVKLRKVSVPFREPFRISYGAVAQRESIVVELCVGEHSGFGEAAPMPESIYSKETPESTWVALERWYVPLWMSKDFEHPREVGSFLDQVPWEGFPRAAVEGAAWDLACRQRGEPLWKMLGSRPRPIESGLAIGIFETIDELLERVECYCREGYRRVKIKIEPGWDIEPVKAIRERLGDIPLMVDANTAYKPGQIAIFQELDRFHLLMFEQPLAADALEDMAEWQRHLSTPICVDESAESHEALEKIIELKAARIVNIKVQRVGGLSDAMKMYHRAIEAGLEIWLGTMPELGIASAQSLHLATLPGFNYPTDVEASMRWYEEDIIEPLISIDSQGLIHLPEGPGSGYRVDPERLARYTVQEVEFDGS